MKDKSTQMSIGKAVITFFQDSAQQAIKKYNNSIIIRNIIRVKPYFNYHLTDQKANILIENLPENANSLELEKNFQDLAQCYQLIQIQINQESNQRLCLVLKEADADDLIKRIQKYPITFKGNILKLNQSKFKIEGKGESSIYLRAFAAPLPQDLINQNTTVGFIEYGWTLVIKDYLTRVQGDEVEECIVKIEKATRQPWAMIKFKTQDQAQRNLEICEKFRKHPCFISNARIAFEQIKKHGPPANSDNNLQFTIQEIEPFFEKCIKTRLILLKVKATNFYLGQQKISDTDERLITFDNIQQKATKEQILEFLIIWKSYLFNIRKAQNKILLLNPRGFKRALSEIQDNSNENIAQQKREIFNNGQPIIDTNLTKTSGDVNIIKIQNENNSAIPSIIKTNEHIQNYEKQLPNFLQEFMDYSIVQRQMEDFLRIPIDAQRLVLSNLLFKRIFLILNDKENQNVLLKGWLIHQNMKSQIFSNILKIKMNFNPQLIKKSNILKLIKI